MLRPTVSRPVCLGTKHPFGTYDQIWQLRVCWFGAPSLTRGRVCRLQLLLVLARAVIFGSESRRTDLSFRTSSSYNLRTNHTENTAPLLLCEVIEQAQATRTQRKHCCCIVVWLHCLRGNVFTEPLPKTGCITPLFYCCVHVLLSNGCFCGSTVLAWSK
jgi:hypothetical protein